MKRISVGVENFKELIDKNYYFVDKTLFIQDVINEQIAFYTRPRRFGKTLNMSMLYYFFSIKEKDNAYLFDGLNISKNKEAMKYQNQYPVIFLTLKDMKNSSMAEQKNQFLTLIQDAIDLYNEILKDDKLSRLYKERLENILSRKCTLKDLENSLRYLSVSLKQVYNQNVIILIDEYDVPLQSAYTNGYYDEMVDFLRNMFSSALKTNNDLEKGILTGCLRISKESIFTGLNNFKVNSIMDVTSSDAFGFKQDEIDQLLLDYNLSDCKDEVKEWYDGYLFGKTDIYNPWSTLMYVDRRIKDSSSDAVSFWANTSGNDIVVNYIAEGDNQLHEEFEALIQGKSVTKLIKPELTYRDMDNINNIYSFLLITGYLKIKRKVERNIYELVIPNKEVYEIYNNSFMDYFTELKSENKDSLMQALMNEEEEIAEQIITKLLTRSISYYDEKEMFYHGFMLGILGTYNVESNREAGDGRLDIVVYPETLRGKAIVIECKYASDEAYLIKSSEQAAKQIIDNKYIEGINAKGYRNVIGYGIAFNKKKCYVTKAQL